MKMSTILLVALLHAAPPTYALTSVMEISSTSGSSGHATPISSTLALTALHVVTGNGDVHWKQGFTQGTARVISTLEKRDLAVLRVAEGEEFPFAVVVSRKGLDIFDEVFYVAPDWERKRGMVRAEVAFKYDDGRWGLIAYGWFGMSGGGVFNRKGELVGVLSQLSQGIAQRPGSAPFFAMPIVIVVEVRGFK